MRYRLFLSLLALLVIGGAGVAMAGLNHNPANSRHLIDKPIEDYNYDYAKRCRSAPPKGTRALEKWMKRNVRGETWGIMRCEKWGPGSASLHAEGRAIDWHLDARVGSEKREARKLIGLLLERDRRGNKAALARRMGVQGLIFNCRAWWSGMDRMGEYSYCYRDNGKRKRNLDPTAAHKDHVHIELNWPGARKKTSFWRSRAWRGRPATSAPVAARSAPAGNAAHADEPAASGPGRG